MLSLNQIGPDGIKPIPDNDYYLTPSCILGVLSPQTEPLLTRIYDQLGIRWGMGGPARSRCTCCSGILNHGEVITPEGTLLTVARLWDIAAEQGFDHISTACVTSFAMHLECMEYLEEEPGLSEKVSRWLEKACGRALRVPRHVVHTSDVIYHYRDKLLPLFKHKLVNVHTGRPLKVVDHVGCHYAKIHPKSAIGGAEYCDVLEALVRAWGGESIDYPERRHCCGMGFRQCMITPNRGYTAACVMKKMESMAPFEPDLVLTNCPGCSAMLDKEQSAINTLTGSRYEIPVISYAELTGLLLGYDPYDVVGIQLHTTPMEPLLYKLGIQADRSRAWLS